MNLPSQKEAESSRLRELADWLNQEPSVALYGCPPERSYQTWQAGHDLVREPDGSWSLRYRDFDGRWAWTRVRNVSKVRFLRPITEFAAARAALRELCAG